MYSSLNSNVSLIKLKRKQIWRTKIIHLFSVPLQKVLSEKLLITNRDTCCMPNHCLQLQVPWSFVLLCLCSRTIMKNRQALPSQQPQKPLLTTHERLACSLGEKEGARREGRRTKRKRDAFQGGGQGCSLQKTGRVPLFLQTMPIRNGDLKRWPALHVLQQWWRSNQS